MAATRPDFCLAQGVHLGRKIEALVGDVEQPFEYGNVFSRETVRGVERLRIGLDDEHNRCLRTLTSPLIEPFQLLYVLHTTRTEAALGRYESPELDLEAVQAFLERFAQFLSEDARHDLWIRSHGNDATIVFDRHNLIYAYGPLDAFESTLRTLAFALAARRRFRIRTCTITTSNGTATSARCSKLSTGSSSRFANPTFSSSRSRASLHQRSLGRNGKDDEWLTST